MAEIQGLDQGSDKWKTLRSSMVTSTDSCVILGMNPWKNIHQLLKEKWGLEEVIVTQKMIAGSEMEPLARNAFIERSGIIVKPAVFVSDDHPYLMCSLDGIDESRQNVVEIKCGMKSFAQAKKGEIPPYYICQMNHVMACLNLPFIHYWAFNGKEGILMTVERNEELIQRIIDEGKVFHDHLINLRPFEECIEYPWEVSSEDWENRLKQTWEKAIDDTKTRAISDPN